MTCTNPLGIGVGKPKSTNCSLNKNFNQTLESLARWTHHQSHWNIFMFWYLVPKYGLKNTLKWSNAGSYSLEKKNFRNCMCAHDLILLKVKSNQKSIFDKMAWRHNHRLYIWTFSGKSEWDVEHFKIKQIMLFSHYLRFSIVRHFFKK